MRRLLLFILFAGAAVTFHAGAYADFFEDAERFMRNGEYNKAAEAYEKALAKDPNSPRIYSRLGQVLYHLANYEDSMRQFWEVLRLAPDEPDAHLWMGKLYSKRGFLKRALQEIENAVSLNPDLQGEGNLIIGDIYRENGIREKAIVYYERALDLMPDNAEAQHSLGNIYLSMDQKERAKERFKKAVEADPVHYKALLTLGNLAYEEKDFEKAEEYYLRANAVRDRSVDANLHLGIMLERKGEQEMALQYYKKVVKLAPDDYKTRNSIGIIYMYQGKIHEAIKQFEEAIGFKPDFPWAYSNLGIAYRKLKKYEEAVRCLQKSIEIEPDNPAFYNNLGNVYYEKNDYLGAMVEFEKAKRIRDDPIVDRKIGLCFLRQGMYNEAIAYLKKAISVYPDRAAFRADLGEALSAANFFEEAEKELSLAIESDPEETRYILIRAINFVRWNKGKDAAELLDEYLKKEPESIEAHYLIGDVCEKKLGNLAKAHTHFKVFLELAPEDRRAWDVRKRMKRLKKKLGL